MRRSVPIAALAALLLGASPCGGDDTPPPPAGTRIVIDYEGAAFWDVPFPDEARRGADGLVSFAAFSTQGGTFGARLTELAEATPAFGTTSPIFFRADGPLDGSSVASSYAESLEDGAPVLLVRLDGPTPGAPHPVEVRYAEDGGPWGAPYFVSLLPLQGAPLAPDALYAAVVTTDVRDADGEPLGRADAVVDLAAGSQPAGLSDAAFAVHRDALAALTPSIPVERIAALAVFRTADPTAALRDALALALARPLPGATDLALSDVFDGYCVYEGTTRMPDYQRGVLPYDDGGGWDLSVPPIDAAARVVVTIPRASSTDPIPTVVFSRTGAGGDRPLADRGVHLVAGGAAEPGTGPAQELAAAGFAAISIDGPHGGPRNPTMGDEQFLMFNVLNPLALRDNVRQSALELAVAAHVAEALAIDASDCPDVARTVSLAPRVVMGHSMGATIAPLALAVEPRFEAAVLSGAGSSYVMNVIYKESPLAVRPLAEVVVGVAGRYMLHEHDPLLGVYQWALESADPPPYARSADDRHVLMLQGIVDTYILPPIANGTSLALHLDLGGAPLDETEPRLAQYTPISELLPLSGGERVTLPAAGNGDGGTTRIVVQYPEDGIEDGHEIAFQTAAPKAAYRSFLETLVSEAAPIVP